MHIFVTVVIFLAHVPSVTPLQPDRKGQSVFQNKNEPKLAKQLVQVSSENKDAQPASGVGTTSYENWFQRMGDSIGNFIASPIMMCLAISIMWLNERRNARMETLLSKGIQDVRVVKSNAASPDNRGCLVHINDGKLHGVGTLMEDNFTRHGQTKAKEVTTADPPSEGGTISLCPVGGKKGLSFPVRMYSGQKHGIVFFATGSGNLACAPNGTFHRKGAEGEWAEWEATETAEGTSFKNVGHGKYLTIDAQGSATLSDIPVFFPSPAAGPADVPPGSIILRPVGWWKTGLSFPVRMYSGQKHGIVFFDTGSGNLACAPNGTFHRKGAEGEWAQWEATETAEGTSFKNVGHGKYLNIDAQGSATLSDIPVFFPSPAPEPENVPPASKEMVHQSQVKIALSDIIKWETSVEVYQWWEQKHEKKEKDRFGGGETTKVTYEYTKLWDTAKNDSTKFHDKHGHVNSFLAGDPYVSRKTVDRVEYGDSFLLPKDLVGKLNDFVDASDTSSNVGDMMACDSVMWGKHIFNKAEKQEIGDGSALGKAIGGAMETYWKTLVEMLPGNLTGAVYADMSSVSVPAFHYYWRDKVPTYRGGDEPRIGDYRVAFRCVPDGLGTVLALQAESDDAEKSNRDTFLPYRAIERRWCGWTDDMEKEALLKEGRKSDEELEEQDRCCGGTCILCCCCCNLVNCVCSYVARPQIFSAHQGGKSVSESFSILKQSNRAFTWLIRLLGWILSSVALHMFLSPLTTFLDVIPLIGWLGNKAISLIAGFVSIVITLLIISAAYLIYHPSIGIPMLAGVLILISIPIIINAYLQKHK